MLEHPVLAVGEDDEQDVEAVMGCRPERLNAVHGRAISGESHDGPIGMRHLYPQGAGQTLADATTARRVVVTRLCEPEARGDLEQRGDGFVDHHGVFGQRAAKLVDAARGRHGRGIPQGPRAGSQRLPLGRPLLFQPSIAVPAGGLEVGVRRVRDGRGQERQGRAQVPDHAQRKREVVGKSFHAFLDLDRDGVFGNRVDRVEPHLFEERAAD